MSETLLFCYIVGAHFAALAIGVWLGSLSKVRQFHEINYDYYRNWLSWFPAESSEHQVKFNCGHPKCGQCKHLKWQAAPVHTRMTFARTHPFAVSTGPVPPLYLLQR